MKNKISPLPIEVSSSEFLTELRQQLQLVGYQFKIIDQAYEIQVFDLGKSKFTERLHALENSKGVFRFQRGECFIYLDTNIRHLMAVNQSIFAEPSEKMFSRLEMSRLLRDIIALIHSLDGEIVLHANVLSFQDGRAIGFLGESGQGKSTLSLALAREGAQLLSDDICAFEMKTGRVLFQSDTLNVGSSTYQALIKNDSSFLSKDKLTIRVESDQSLSSEYYLKTIYKLTSSTNEEISIEDLSSAQAVYELMKCAIFDPREIGKSVEQYALERASLSQRIPVRQIKVPRNLAKLVDVYARLASLHS